MSDDSASIQENPATLIEPVQPGERIQTLDVLRGFALFGILFVNVTALVQPVHWFTVHWETLGPVNYAVEALKIFFTQGKFYSLFAFLFGLGFAVQLARAERAGRNFAGRFFWRVFLLWLIGVIHFVLLWDGDILNTYGIAGMLLLLFYGMKRGIDRLVRPFSKGRREAPRWTVLVMAGLLLFGPLLAFAGFINHAFDVRARAATGVTLSESEQNIMKQLDSMEDPVARDEREQQQAREEEIYATGSYLDVVGLRIEKSSRLVSGPFWFMVAGLFMVGAYFGRNNFIGRAAELRSGFRKLLVSSAVIGVPLSALFLYALITQPEQQSLSWWQWLNFFSKSASGLAFALFYVAAISLLMLTLARRWLEFFAPVGRTALSNYLLQSLIGTFVFYGYGLGLMGKLDATEQLGYIALLFTGQVWLSRWWLARFRFGPAEWLWRSLTYGKRQPMRIRKAPIDTPMAGSQSG